MRTLVHPFMPKLSNLPQPCSLGSMLQKMNFCVEFNVLHVTVFLPVLALAVFALKMSLSVRFFNAAAFQFKCSSSV